MTKRFSLFLIQITENNLLELFLAFGIFNRKVSIKWISGFEYAFTSQGVLHKNEFHEEISSKALRSFCIFFVFALKKKLIKGKFEIASKHVCFSMVYHNLCS